MLSHQRFPPLPSGALRAFFYGRQQAIPRLCSLIFGPEKQQNGSGRMKKKKKEPFDGVLIWDCRTSSDGKVCASEQARGAPLCVFHCRHRGARQHVISEPVLSSSPAVRCDHVAPNLVELVPLKRAVMESSTPQHSIIGPQMTHSR